MSTSGQDVTNEQCYRHGSRDAYLQFERIQPGAHSAYQKFHDTEHHHESTHSRPRPFDPPPPE
eukprot:3592132-Pyramimonas_sp.AAC.1